MALLATASVLAVAIALSILIIREVQSSGRIGQSVIAFHAAESGIEEGLYRTKTLRLSGATIETALEELDTDTTSVTVAQRLDESVSLWNRTADADVDTITVQRLPEDQSTFYQIFNNDVTGNPPRWIAVSWSSEDLVRLEVTWIGWDATTGFSDQVEKSIVNYDSAGANIKLEVQLETLTGIVPTFFDYYEVQFRTLNDGGYTGTAADIQNLTIQAFDNDPSTCALDCQIPIPSSIRITSVGEHPRISVEKSKQALRADIAWNPPLSGLYSFVLFSECLITKSNTVSCPSP